MERMTLREAAERTSRSITTLRRYIRSGRLNAEKRFGRFGPEYYVTEDDLASAGLDSQVRATALAPATRGGNGALTRESSRRDDSLTERLLRDTVPLGLYQELQMKHEQLLVQYGMVRAGGLRVMELQADLEERQRQLDEARAAVARLRDGQGRDRERLSRELRAAQLELEGRRLEIDALHEKVRGLEMLTRNAVTNETIESQFKRMQEQTRRVEELGGGRSWGAGENSAWSPSPDAEPDH